MTPATESKPAPPQVDVEALLAADIASLQREQAATRQANAEPLPGPIHTAFAAEAKPGLKLRPVVASDFILLKRLNSPLYRRTFELAEHARKISVGELPTDAPLPATTFDDEECVEMIYQFSIPLPQARAELKRGREFFREQAHQAITDTAPVDALPTLVALVVENFTAAFATAVKYEAPTKEGEETVFTTPAAAGATASAGGLTTSRASLAEIPARKPLSPTNSP